jgi:hypothetical protein
MIKKNFMFTSSFCQLLITAANIHAATVDLSWNPPINGGSVVGYIVYASKTSGDYSNPVAVEIVDGTDVTVTGLDKRNKYYFVVKAFNCADLSDDSNEISVEAYSEAFHDDGTDTTTSNGIKVESGGSSGGCFIASAAYGSPFESHVKVLREFRDSCLMRTGLGRAFVNFYYEYSPALADVIRKHDSMRAMVRWGLAPVVGVAYVVLNTSMVEKVGIVVVMVGMLVVCCFVVRRKVKGSRFTVEERS